MSKSLLTNQAYHESQECSDVHHDKGFHREYSLGWENGELCQTILPQIQSEVDFLNGWHEPSDLRSDRYGDAGEALGRMLDYLLGIEPAQATLTSIGIRAVALLFATRPGKLPWRGMKEAAHHFGITKQAISRRNAEIFALANGHYERGGSFAGASRRAASSAGSRRSWARRKQSPSLEGITETTTGHTPGTV